MAWRWDLLHSRGRSLTPIGDAAIGNDNAGSTAFGFSGLPDEVAGFNRSLLPRTSLRSLAPDREASVWNASRPLAVWCPSGERTR